MKKAIALLLSLTTIVGGHFFNKRNDRAILFLSVFFFWFVCIVTALPFIYEKLDRPLADTTFTLYLKFGVLVIWAVSAFVTYIDARNATKNNDKKTSWSWKVGATILSIFMGIATISVLSTFFRESLVPERASDSYQEPVEHNFQHYVGFGGVKYPEPEYSEPPKGQGIISGSFIYEGRPVTNLKLEITLNGKYKTELIETDVDGKFTLQVPYSIWYLNRIHTTSWPEKPTETKFIILSGQEALIDQYQKNPHWFPDGSGLQFQLTEDTPHKNFEFKIVPQIDLLWPGPKGRELKADKESIIHWESYPSASKYLVWVQSIESNFTETETTYSAALSTIVEGTNKLPLAEIITPDDSKNIYQIKVFAFNDAGEYLSESKAYYHKGNSFVINGYKIESEEVRKIKERYNQ